MTSDREDTSTGGKPVPVPLAWGVTRVKIVTWLDHDLIGSWDLGKLFLHVSVPSVKTNNTKLCCHIIAV